MFVKERVAAMKKLEDAREKARMAVTESSRRSRSRGEAAVPDTGGQQPSGNALNNTSSSDVHSSSGGTVSIPELPPKTARLVIRVGPPVNRSKGDHTGGRSVTYSGSTGGEFHNPNYLSNQSRTKAVRPSSSSSSRSTRRRQENRASAEEQSRSDHSASPSQTPSSALYMMEPAPLMNTALSSGRYALNSPNQLSSELDDRKMRKKIDRLTKDNREMQETLSSHHKVMELVVKKMGDIQAELQSMRTGSLLSDPPDNAQSVFKDVADSCDSSQVEDSAEEEQEQPSVLIADLQEHVVSLEAQLQLLTLDMTDEGESLCCFTYY